MATSATRARVIAAVVLCVAGVTLTASTPAAAATAGSNSLTVTARDYSYDVSGAPKSGWTRVTFENEGSEFHQLLVVALKPGVTGAQVRQAVAGGDPQAAIAVIGTGLAPGLPFLLGPRGEATTIAMLGAGRYALVCFLAGPDGRPHAAEGMVRVLRVARTASDLKPPTKDITDVTTSDRAITVADGTLPARGWARITTTAPTPRDFELFRYATPDATFEATNTYFREFFSSGTAPAGPAPAVIVGNVSSIPSGAVVYYQLSLEPAMYVVVSDTASDQDGNAQVHQDITVE